MDTCDYVINMLSSVIAIEYMNRGLERKYAGWRHLLISAGGGAVYFILVTALNFLTDFEGILCIFYTMGLVLYGLAALKGILFNKVFLSLMWTLNILFSTFIVYGLTGLSTGKSIADLLSGADRETIFYASLAATAVKFLTGRIIIRLYDWRKETAEREDWLIAVVLTAILLAGLIMFRLELNLTEEKNRYGQLTFLLVGQFMGVLLLEKLYQKLEENKRQKIELDFRNKMTRELGRWRHDMSGRLTTIYRLQRSGQYREAEEILEKLCGEFGSLPELAQPTCSNGLNTALVKALARCRDMGIRFSYVVLGRPDIIDDMDMESLMWNLLSNGIEACQQAEEPRTLHVFFHVKETCLNIRIENTIAKSVLENNPQLHSTKENKERHGFGMETVYRVLEKYRGDYLCREENNFFVQELCLYSLKS